MPALSKFSHDHLNTCAQPLIDLFEAVAEITNIRIICGYRDKYDQDLAFETGHSEKQWPDSNHNELPSKGVDAVPFPIDWKEERRFYFLAGIVKAKAIEMGIKVRGGYDWDSDQDFNDQKFDDLAHWELV